MSKKQTSALAIARAVTHGELQDELKRLRIAVMVLTNILTEWHVMDDQRLRRIMDLVSPPEER